MGTYPAQSTAQIPPGVGALARVEKGNGTTVTAINGNQQDEDA